jgi:hypothetical protein
MGRVWLFGCRHDALLPPLWPLQPVEPACSLVAAQCGLVHCKIGRKALKTGMNGAGVCRNFVHRCQKVTARGERPTRRDVTIFAHNWSVSDV